MSYYAAGGVPRDYFAPGWKGTLAWAIVEKLPGPVGKVVDAELRLLKANTNEDRLEAARDFARHATYLAALEGASPTRPHTRPTRRRKRRS